MADRFLDSIGLRHLWEKIKAWIPFLSRKTQSIPFGRVDSTSTATAFTAEIDGIDSLRSGVCCYLRNGVVPSESGYTLDINGLGAKPVYDNMHDSLRSTTEFDYGCTMLFVYNSDRVVGGCWDIYHPEGLLFSTNDYNDDFNDDFGYGDDIPDGGVEYDAGNEITIENDTISSGHVNINGHSGSYALHPFALMACTSTNKPSFALKMEPFTKTGGLNGKEKNSALYPIGCQIYYHPDEIAYSADTDFVGKRFYATYDKVDARYSAVDPTNLNLAAGNVSSVYLRVIVKSNGWSVSQDPKDEIIVTADNLIANNWYIYLGKTNGDENSYTFQLERNHPLYFYDGNDLISYESYFSVDRHWYASLPEQTIDNTGIMNYGTNGNLLHLKKGLYKVTVQRNIRYAGSSIQYAYLTFKYSPDSSTYTNICADSITLHPPGSGNLGYLTEVFSGVLSIPDNVTNPYMILQQEGPNGLVLGGDVPYGNGQNAHTIKNDFILLERLD